MNEQIRENNPSTESTTPSEYDGFSEILRDRASQNYWMYMKALIDGDAVEKWIITTARQDLRSVAILPTADAVSSYIRWLHIEIGFHAESLVDEICETLRETERLAERM